MLGNLMKMDDIFNDFLTLSHPRWVFDPWRSDFTVDRDANNYIIRASVPGFEEKELNILTRGNVLTVSGKHEKTTEGKDYFVGENTSFERSYTLPNDAQIDSISAEYRAGVLVVSVPKRKSSLAELKTVPIKALGPGS